MILNTELSKDIVRKIKCQSINVFARSVWLLLGRTTGREPESKQGNDGVTVTSSGGRWQVLLSEDGEEEPDSRCTLSTAEKTGEVSRVTL